MRPAAARVITYGVIAGVAGLAIAFTPAIPARAPARPPAPTAAASDAAPAASAAGAITRPDGTVELTPAVVYAERLPGIDTIAVGGTIHSSLFAALQNTAATELPSAQRRSLAWHLADIFEHRIDMSRDLSEGDTFRVLVERLQQPNGKIIINRILGAKLSLHDETYEAVRFKSRNTSSEWFDGKGKSLTASFLHAPLAFRRISSVFGLRSHPIFGTWRRHTGTDYAAPMGTPVRAIGDGVVVAAGWRGGYGNCVDIRHPNGFVSRYGHLRNFARGIRPGARVKMGSTIGFVGMTGWATGPHLHFEIRVNGRPRDPRVALRGNSGAPLPASEERLFREIKEHTMAALDAPEGERVASR